MPVICVRMYSADHIQMEKCCFKKINHKINWSWMPNRSCSNLCREIKWSCSGETQPNPRALQAFSLHKRARLECCGTASMEKCTFCVEYLLVQQSRLLPGCFASVQNNWF